MDGQHREADAVRAAFGAIKPVFQDGYLHDLPGFTPIGAVDAGEPLTPPPLRTR
ncbi:hypothetical protein [Kitasatospora sp. NPDC005751]|uniref:hypothetical protein n=1 Tax=Kitasatospora sp. NPDC005751 TaxID=3157064 RepID=UPI0033E04F17